MPVRVEKEIGYFYVTKYTLSSGEVRRLQLEYKPDENYAYTLRGEGSFQQQFVIGRDCFENWDDAVKAFSVAREKKIAALKRQMAKLEKMAIKKPD